MYENIQLTWVKPQKVKRWAITIPNEKCCNINHALLAEIPDKIDIGYNVENGIIAIRPAEDGFKVPKSGSLKIPSVIQEFTSHSLRFPACFIVKKENDLWIGKLEEQPPLERALKKPPSKPHKPNMHALKKEADTL